MYKFRRFKVPSIIILLLSSINILLMIISIKIIQYTVDYHLTIGDKIKLTLLFYIIPISVSLIFTLLYFNNIVLITNEKISIKVFKKTKTYCWEDITSYSIGFVTCLKIDKKSIIFSTNKSSRQFIADKLNVKLVESKLKTKIIGVCFAVGAYLAFILIALLLPFQMDHKDKIESYITWDESIKEVTSEEYYMDMNITKTLTQKLSIFPNNINNNADYYNSYIEVSGISNYFIQETYLKYKYNDLEFFNKEIYRLNNLEIYNVKSNTSKKCLYIENMFDFPVYISIYNYDKCYEYALVDEMNLTIHYIYINNNNDFYIFDEIYRPTKKLIYYYEHMLYSIYE